MRLKWFLFSVIILFIHIQANGSVWGLAGNPTVFKNVTLVPMTAEKIVHDQTVLVNGRRITAIGPSSAIDMPDGSMVIDGSGLYLMPGLADMHVHTDTRWLNGGWPVSPLDLFLANGVTTIRDFGPVGSPPDYALHWRNEIEKGRLRGPTIYAAGPILYGPVDNARKIVRDQKALGFDFVKLYSFLSQREFHDAMAAASELNSYTAGHIPFAVGLDGVLSAGMNEIAHIEELVFELVGFDRSRSLGHEQWFDYILQVATEQMGPLADLSVEELRNRYQSEIEPIIRKLAASGTPLCTTLCVSDIVVQKLFHAERIISAPTARYLPYRWIQLLQQRKDGHQIQFSGHEDFAPFLYILNQLFLRELHNDGVTLVLGTDAGEIGMGLVPGFSLHDELRILTENGFTPYEAIRTATISAAAVIDKGIGKGDFGTLEVGKKADLLLVNGNPLDDIHHLKQIDGVMACGQWFDRAAVQKMLIPMIPFTAGVQHVVYPDSTHSAHFDIVIGKGFSRKLPEAIDAITVTGPEGRLPIEKDDFTFLPHLRDFWISIPGIPRTGTYTFDLISGSKSGRATVVQSEIKSMPLPDATLFYPLNGVTLTTDSQTFSWKAVKTELPVYYRLEINDFHGKRVYATGARQGMLSHTVPACFLKPGNAYRWRIRITDNPHWQQVQNRSQSDWQIVHIK
jgi:hypothetical protein